MKLTLNGGDVYVKDKPNVKRSTHTFSRGKPWIERIKSKFITNENLPKYYRQKFRTRLRHISNTKKELMISNEGKRDGNIRSNLNVYKHLNGNLYFCSINIICVIIFQTTGPSLRKIL